MTDSQRPDRDERASARDMNFAIGCAAAIALVAVIGMIIYLLTL